MSLMTFSLGTLNWHYFLPYNFDHKRLFHEYKSMNEKALSQFHFSQMCVTHRSYHTDLTTPF